MAAIDRVQLYQDDLLWLPSTNVLTQDQINQINEFVIADVGDDDTKYPEVLCKSLKALATANLGKATANSNGMRSQEVGDVEIQWFNPSESPNVWQSYIKSLEDICPIFGYYGLTANVGIRITTGPEPIINPSCDNSDLDF